MQERHETRPLNSVICLLGAQRHKSLGKVGKTGLSTNVFEIAWCARACVRAWNSHWFGPSVVLSNASFLYFCTSLSSSGSLYWALNLCPPLRLRSGTFQYIWRLRSSYRWSLELCIEQFLHLNLLARYWLPEVSVHCLDLVSYRAEMINPKMLGSSFSLREEDIFSS